MIASVIANANRDRKKRINPYTPQDFMPKRKKEVQTWEQQLKIVKMWNVLYKGIENNSQKGG